MKIEYDKEDDHLYVNIEISSEQLMSIANRLFYHECNIKPGNDRVGFTIKNENMNIRFSIEDNMWCKSKEIVLNDEEK